MGRRRRRRKKRVWIGVVVLLVAFAAVTFVFVNMLVGSGGSETVSDAPPTAFDLSRPTHTHEQKSSDTSPEATQEVNAQNDEFLILVNKDHPNLSGDRPEGLVELREIFCDGSVILQNPEGSVNETAGIAARKMLRDAQNSRLGRFVITTAYRSVEFQDKLYKDYIARHPEQTIGKVLPGYASEHSTGLALDILSEAHNNADDDFINTPEGKWLSENAHKYGFIMRYPYGKGELTGVIFEPWHYRYVGVDAATEIYNKGICLEEYLGEN